MAARWRVVVHATPPLPAAVTLRVQDAAAADGGGGGAGGWPAGDDAFTATLAARGWRAFLFGHVTPAQMLHEVADALYGVSERLAPAAPHRHALRTFDDVVEGVRRVTLLIDPRRTGAAALTPPQRAALAAALLRDAGARHLLPPDDGAPATEHDARRAAAAQERFIPLRFGRRPDDLMRDMPAWFVAAGKVQVHCTRALAGALGVPSCFVETRLGSWHTYIADGRAAAGGGGSGLSAADAARPIVLCHGMFTTSASLLPLALVLAARCRRLVLVPGLLDFDFGYSRSRHEEWVRLRATRAAARAGMLGDPATNAVGGTRGTMPDGRVPADRDSWSHDQWAALEWADAISPLSMSDHIAAVAEYLNVGVPRACAVAGGTPTLPPDVIGHSFGGWVVAKIAARSPASVRRVALLAPGGLGRYRILCCAAPMAGLRTCLALLQERMAPPTARAAATMFDILCRAPFAVHLLTSLDYHDYFEPGEVVPHEVLLAWGTDDDVHAVWGVASVAAVAAGGAGGAANTTADTTADTAADTTAADSAAASRQDAAATLLADLPRGRGVWIHGAGHSVVVDSIPTLVRLLPPFFNSGTLPFTQPPSPPAVPTLHTAAAALLALATWSGGDRATSPMTPPLRSHARL